MNIRLKELMLEAGYAAPELAGRAHNLAELIVSECISTIENAENGYRDYRNQIEDGMRDHCIGLIKHKFGVEDHEEDSACPLCGEDGGTTCGIPGCQY